MRQMLLTWLRTHFKRGWSDIISALVNIQRYDVADEVARQYGADASLGKL